MAVEEGVDGELAPIREGRLDKYRDLGFATPDEQRQASKTDLARYNAKRRAKGKNPVTWEQFEELADGNAISSSISASEGEDEHQADPSELPARPGGNARAHIPCQDGNTIIAWR